MVGIDGIFYAGSHGFDCAGPGGFAEQHAVEFVPELDRAEMELRSLLSTPGVRVERKRFAIAVHVRQVDERNVPVVEAAVDRVALAHRRLRRVSGRRCSSFVRTWSGTRSARLLRLMSVLGLDRDDVVPVYVGDDLTDEDAFIAFVRDRGLGVVVRGMSRSSDVRPLLPREPRGDRGVPRRAVVRR